MKECNEVEQYLEAYALGALDSDDASRVEQHLEVCTQCRELLAEYTAVTGVLADALRVASPYALDETTEISLFHGVSAAIDPNTDQSGRAEKPSYVPAPVGASADKAAGPAVHSGQNANDAGNRSFLWRFTLAFAGFMLVVAVVLSIRLNVVEASEQRLHSRLNLLFSQQEIVLEVIDSEETTRRVLLPPQEDSRAYGKLFTREGMVHVVAMAARLSAPPEGQAYRLWIESHGETNLAGTMTVNPEGFGLIVFDAEDSSPSYDAAKLILQAEDSNTPSGSLVLIWE